MRGLLVVVSMLLALASCLTCPQGSVANWLNVCISPKYIEGCSLYLNEDQCKICNYRYTLLSNGLCNLETQTNEDCCKVRGSQNQCITCQAGLYLIAGKCQQSNIVGCLEKDASGVCINCATDYVLQNGVCESGIKNCVAYTDSTNQICTTCAADHSLISNICVRNLVLGCKNEVNHICKECYKPFFLSNGSCEVRHCKSYNEYKCVACDCGFYLTSDGVCRKMELGCVRYRGGTCTDCLPHFKLKGSKCDMEGCLELNGLQCKSCDANYELLNGGCQMKNCLQWKEGSCQICKSGYNYQSGKCISGQSVISQ